MHTFRSDKTFVGVDEVGKGSLAGPVVAAAVLWNEGTVINGIKDSKLLSQSAREDLAIKIEKAFRVGMGIISASQINKVGITEATFAAMYNAVTMLGASAARVLVDGPHIPPPLLILRSGVSAIVDGDAKVQAISCASIVAKVYRDRLMKKLHTQFPAYGWDRNKGYGTAEHKIAVLKLGLSVQHRHKFCRFYVGV
jgi:ribonuclease HII